jgi:hypothetical protein
LMVCSAAILHQQAADLVIWQARPAAFLIASALSQKVIDSVSQRSRYRAQPAIAGDGVKPGVERSGTPG